MRSLQVRNASIQFESGDGTCRRPFLECAISGRGGAEGTSEYSAFPSDGYTDNWLNTVSVSIGAWIK